MTDSPIRPMGSFNAERCAEYLRFIGVEIDDATAAAWQEQERADRRRRRSHKRELKRSCGHFRKLTTLVTSEAGSFIVWTCRDCRAPVDARPTSRTMQFRDGRRGADGIPGPGDWRY